MAVASINEPTRPRIVIIRSSKHTSRTSISRNVRSARVSTGALLTRLHIAAWSGSRMDSSTGSNWFSVAVSSVEVLVLQILERKIEESQSTSSVRTLAWRWVCCAVCADAVAFLKFAPVAWIVKL